MRMRWNFETFRKKVLLLIQEHTNTTLPTQCSLFIPFHSLDDIPGLTNTNTNTGIYICTHHRRKSSSLLVYTNRDPLRVFTYYSSLSKQHHWGIEGIEELLWNWRRRIEAVICVGVFVIPSSFRSSRSSFIAYTNCSLSFKCICVFESVDDNNIRLYIFEGVTHILMSTICLPTHIKLLYG